MKLFTTYFWAVVILTLFAACNKSDTITDEPNPDPPKISFENASGIYALKTGHSLLLEPEIENEIDADYYWFADNHSTPVARTKNHTFAGQTEGTFYLTFRVETLYGADEFDIQIEVSESSPALISFAVPDDRMEVVAGADYLFHPVLVNADGAAYEWLVDGKTEASGTVGAEGLEYRFNAAEQKTYTLTLKVDNGDGIAEKSLYLTAVGQLPLNLFFESPMFGRASTDVHLFSGQAACLWPVVEGGEGPFRYEWTVDGVADSETGEQFVFEAPDAGEYTVGVTVVSGSEAEPQRLGRGVTRTGLSRTSAEVKVVCHGDESAGFRAPVAGSSPFSSKVYEYIPAPGQFINEDLSGFTGEETTPAAAAAYAERRLEQERYVSLGGFGGFITVGFDHSIEHKGAFNGYDFAIAGNQMAESSEPGIVWVMQDANGNGLPDDVWYELKGSETGKPETVSRYAVTYIRPAGAKSAVPWRDNLGATGQIDYLAAFHRQDCYYPLWVEADSYTLRGTRVTSRIEQKGGDWVVHPLAWGYADNLGKDRLSEEGNPEADPKSVYFRIANAVRSDGTPVNLSYVDFIKVQTGTNAQAGRIGEISTEVFSFRDMNL